MAERFLCSSARKPSEWLFILSVAFFMWLLTSLPSLAASAAQKYMLPGACPDLAIRSALTADEQLQDSSLGLIAFGGQVIDSTSQLHIYFSRLPRFTRNKDKIAFRRYFLIIATKTHKVRCEYVGSFWALENDFPFSGGILIGGLPVVFDAIDPDLGYQHYVYWEGKYRRLSTFTAPELLKVINLITDNPKTYKYLFDWSEGESRFDYD